MLKQEKGTIKENLGNISWWQLMAYCKGAEARGRGHTGVRGEGTVTEAFSGAGVAQGQRSGLGHRSRAVGSGAQSSETLGSLFPMVKHT